MFNEVKIKTTILYAATKENLLNNELSVDISDKLLYIYFKQNDNIFVYESNTTNKLLLNEVDLEYAINNPCRIIKFPNIYLDLKNNNKSMKYEILYENLTN
jgi:hypothetical protein